MDADFGSSSANRPVSLTIAGTGGAGGTVALAQVFTTSGLSVTTNGLSTVKGAAIDVSGNGGVSFSGSGPGGVEFSNAAGLSVSTNGALNSDITFGAFVRTNSIGAHYSLSLEAGASGKVTVGGLIGAASGGAGKEVKDLSIDTKAIPAGTVWLNGAYATGSITIGQSKAQGGTIRLAAAGASSYQTFTSGGGAIHFYGPVYLDYPANVITIQSAGGTDDDITFEQTLMSYSKLSASLTGLSLLEGARGKVAIVGFAGDGPGLNSNYLLLSLSIGSSASPGAGAVSLNNVFAWKGLSVATKSTGSTTLNGSVYTVVGSASAPDPMLFDSPTKLTQTTTTFTGGGESGANDDYVQFKQTLDGNTAGCSARIVAAASSVTFTGAVGVSQPLFDLTVASSGKTTFGSSAGIADNASLTVDDLDILGALSVTGTSPNGILSIYGRTASNTIGLGSAAGAIQLSNTDLQDIVAARVITIGQSGTQTGVITATGTAFLAGVTGLSQVNLNSDGSTGGIALNDTSGTALNLAGNANTVLTLARARQASRLPTAAPTPASPIRARSPTPWSKPTRSGRRRTSGQPAIRPGSSSPAARSRCGSRTRTAQAASWPCAASGT